MAIANASLTVSKERDVDACYWFYKLQASTGTVPTKAKMVLPSSKGQPPTDTTGASGSWSSSEPSYTAGDTRTLYVVELTYFTDGTAEFSDVSVSSSYEASKQAYNEAQVAKTQATNYLTDITGGGIFVHEDDPDWDSSAGDSVKITDSSVDIMKGGRSVASFGETVRLGIESGSYINLDSDSIDFMDGTTQIGYVGTDSARFPIMHVSSRMSVGNKYEWRITPSGSLGLYLM